MIPPIFLGVGAALLTALCQTATDIGTKAATREAEERLILAAEWIVSAALLWGLCLIAHPGLLVHPAAAFGDLARPDFVSILIAAGGLNVIAYFFFVRAFRLSDASLAAPLVLVTPVLLLLTSPLMVAEYVSALGAFGVGLSVIGAIFLAMSEPGATRRMSLLAFGRDPGVRSMLMAAVIWSVTANLDKIGVRASTPLLWIASLSTIIAISSSIIWLVLPHRPLRPQALRYAIIAGAANAIGNAMQMYALTLLFVPYVIALKRMSALFTVIVGGIVLGENIRGRLLAAALMLAGAAVMAFAHQ